MSNKSSNKKPTLRLSLLCSFAIILVFSMLRLGIWQLNRAEEKRIILAQLELSANGEAAPIESFLNVKNLDDLRFRKVTLTGEYLRSHDMFVDNQVVNGQVGYHVITPFQVIGSDTIVLIARGWVSVGISRDMLPSIETQAAVVTLKGRLNTPFSKPPLWNDKYPVSSGAVWQFLPAADIEDILGRRVFPLMVELASDENDDRALVRKWPEITDQWVAKHQGYAFQWFAMAAAFFIACLVLLLRRVRKNR